MRPLIPIWKLSSSYWPTSAKTWRRSESSWRTTMAKRTKSPEEIEWEATRDERDRLLTGG
jgi:hypothetical protein